MEARQLDEIRNLETLYTVENTRVTSPDTRLNRWRVPHVADVFTGFSFPDARVGDVYKIYMMDSRVFKYYTKIEITEENKDDVFKPFFGVGSLFPVSECVNFGNLYVELMNRVLDQSEECVCYGINLNDELRKAVAQTDRYKIYSQVYDLDYTQSPGQMYNNYSQHLE